MTLNYSINENMQNDLESIASSLSSVSSNVQTVSRKKKVFVYNTGVLENIKKAKKIVTKDPKYLFKYEINYLKFFIKTFEDAHTRNSYQVSLGNFLELYKKGLNVINKRGDMERERIVNLKNNFKIEAKIQLTFELVQSNFDLIRSKITRFQNRNQLNVNRFTTLMRGIGQIVNQLLLCYHYEFKYVDSISKNNIKFEELIDLEEFIETLNEFNNKINDDSIFDFFNSFILQSETKKIYY